MCVGPKEEKLGLLWRAGEAVARCVCFDHLGSCLKGVLNVPVRTLGDPKSDVIRVKGMVEVR